MADGLCTVDAVINSNEKTEVKDCCCCCSNQPKGVVVNQDSCTNVKSCCKSTNSSVKFDNVSVENRGFLDNISVMSCTLSEEDCRKKRCADRYDSSESSDSGVAVLSCTDCSGSSTASSDITDPGSPFSTTSSHSEDSASSPAKMPPTQTAHHPPWPWAAGESPPIKRLNTEKTGFPKRLKMDDEEDDENVLKQVQKVGESKKPPVCLSSAIYHLNSSQIVNKSISAQVLDSNKAPSSNLLHVKNKKVMKKFDSVSSKTQCKITEYFRTQMKANGIKKDFSNATLKISNMHKFFSWDSKQNVTKMEIVSKVGARSPVNKRATNVKNRRLSSVTVPRKILPAPSKVCDNSLNSVSNISSFAPTVTLATLAIPPNLTYLHTKAPKPPDNFIVQQFTTLSDKINAIPIMGTSCINTVIHPLQTPINNFNCFKLNTTVVPIVKLNTLPSNLNGSNINTVALNVDAGVPTVPQVKHKGSESIQTPFVINITSNQSSSLIVKAEPIVERKTRIEEELPSPTSSNSGVLTKEQLLEVETDVQPITEPQKSPILSVPKTIRFPAIQRESTEYKESRSRHSTDSVSCQWMECCTHFDTNGALLEHLQIKHVISQATQEQYECLWSGCKVQGRKSCSRSWLERHVLAHAGTKPFRCIFDGCGMRFNSQVALQRHVNSHFNADGSQNISAKKSVDNGSAKLIRRNGKKLRFRRQPWSARMFDFFDNGIMEGLQHKLLALTETRTQGLRETVPGDTVQLSSQIMARRIESDGKCKMLVRWHPPDVIPDEWVQENEFTSSKSVPIRNLKAKAVNTLNPILFPFQNKQIIRHKQRRKPVKST